METRPSLNSTQTDASGISRPVRMVSQLDKLTADEELVQKLRLLNNHKWVGPDEIHIAIAHLSRCCTQAYDGVLQCISKDRGPGVLANDYFVAST